MTRLYGIKNCDTVKKAQKWLAKEEQPYTFFDFRKDGLSTTQIQIWVDMLSWEVLINKRSTTWKQLNDEERNNLTAELVAKHPTLIKRPVLEKGAEVYVGFKEEVYKELFQ